MASQSTLTTCPGLASAIHEISSPTEDVLLPPIEMMMSLSAIPAFAAGLPEATVSTCTTPEVLTCGSPAPETSLACSTPNQGCGAALPYLIM